ncbi:MAG: hypothetical protein L3J88_08175 [Gammaproteobacteria bacterium]|nr:hypothetical protein [Gammaproteobacteria bacterium]MCF6363307.1 hypothetical protein [Gammaproteobacteria bacterium]
MAWGLKNNPDWHAAAQALIDGCAALDSSELRVRLMERLCTDLGENLYPAFLKILCAVGEFGDRNAQGIVAETLVHALSTGRLPSGKHAAWGATTVKTGGSFGQTRSLGPIEYLCAWYAQPAGRSPLSASAFDHTARALLSLVSVNADAKTLYCAKLRADVDDPLEGALARPTRQALGELIRVWQAGGAPEAIVECYLSTLNGSSLGSLASMPSPFREL